MAARLRLAALLLAPTLALGACGQAGKDSAKGFSGDQRAVAQTVEDLQSAGRKGDASQICGHLLAPALVDQISKVAHGRTCESALKDAIGDADLFELQVQKVAVTGDRATAVVASQGGDHPRTDTFGLQRVGRAWKVASFGP